MRIIATDTAAEAGFTAALLVAALVTAQPTAVLGLATGSSPQTLYEALERENVDLRRVRAFSLDEYLGLGHADPESYAQTIRRDVVERLGLDPALVRTPDGLADDPRQEAAEYERSIRDAGGIDLQILGIGSNGHLAFNEPPSAFDSRTRVVELAQRTRQDNARFFRAAADVPTHAITQGLGTIFEARQLLLIAHGEGKAQAVARAVEGPVTEDFPASLIQRHPRATLVLDGAAASRLQPGALATAACGAQLRSRVSP
ncbi:glucosamine-6-phosphate deaminase [Arthrobacter sp. NicSoilB4]|uniref:glucosamine-6-phosphate deaminase n=1 Tax=Arthrobacter sp. NicSoilB4 TaxID=2830997 RepID=UPI001CC7B8ED|nr:glucosamine-6-phosphate deaminase [Arthrobacter sp. NicSoilB4]BCW68473.1 glucosamine-6-phosphate deaminase [Arthrobacter sp. NicSoilB4]